MVALRYRFPASAAFRTRFDKSPKFIRASDSSKKAKKTTKEIIALFGAFDEKQGSTAAVHEQSNFYAWLLRPRTGTKSKRKF